MTTGFLVLNDPRPLTWWERITTAVLRRPDPRTTIWPVATVEPTATFIPAGLADPDHPTRAERDAGWVLQGPDADSLAPGEVLQGDIVRTDWLDRTTGAAHGFTVDFTIADELDER